MSKRLTDILNNQLAPSTGKHQAWDICKKLLEHLLHRGKLRVHVMDLGEELFGTDYIKKPFGTSDEDNLMESVIQALYGLGLVVRASGSWCFYTGPDVFSVWEKQLIKGYEEYGLKLMSVPVKRADIPPETIRNARRLQWRTRKGKNFAAGIGQAVRNMMSNMEFYEKQQKEGLMNEEQKRSVENMEKMCTCGDGQRRPVMVHGKVQYRKFGRKRRVKCRKCENCLKKKCGVCANCRTPSNHQACIEKICLFPKIPKCPCFD